MDSQQKSIGLTPSPECLIRVLGLLQLFLCITGGKRVGRQICSWLRWVETGEDVLDPLPGLEAQTLCTLKFGKIQGCRHVPVDLGRLLGDRRVEAANRSGLENVNNCCLPGTRSEPGNDIGDDA